MITQNNVPYRVTYTVSDSSPYAGDVEFYIGESPVNETIYCKVFDAEGNQICLMYTPNGSSGWPYADLPGDFIRAEFWRSNQKEPDWVIQINCPNGAAADLADQSVRFNLLAAIENIYVPGINAVLELKEESSYVLCSDVQGYGNFGQHDFALQGWIQTTQAGCLLSLVNGNASPPESVLSLCIEDGGNLAAWIQGERYGMDFGSSLIDDEWHSFNVTLDDVYLAFYIDGIWQGGIPLESKPVLNSITEIVIGKGLTPDRGNDNADEFNGLPLLGQFIGRIADIRIYPAYFYPTQTAMCYRQYKVNTSPFPLGYWDFTTGTFDDQSQYGNNGTAVGTDFESVDLMPVPQEYSFRSRGFGKGAELPGQGDGLNIGTSAFFLEAWVRTTQGGGIVSCGAEAVEGAFLLTAGLSLAIARDGHIAVIVSDGEQETQEVDTQSGTAVIDGSWHHVAAVRDGSGNWYVYLDGLLIHSAPGEAPVSVIPGSVPIRLGYTPAPDDPTLPSGSDDGSVPDDDGLPEITLKEVRIGSGELTQPQIFQTMYQHFDTSGNSLMAYWTFASGNPVNSKYRYADFLTMEGSECFIDNSLELLQPSYAVSNYASAPNIVQYPFGNGEWTVESWVKSTDDLYYLFNTPLTSDSAYGISASASWDNTFIVLLFATGTSEVDETTTQYQFRIPDPGDGVWHHVALVYTGSDYRLYIDGLSAPALTSAQVSMYTSTTSEFWIGNRDNNKGQEFAEFRIWRTARTHAEIQGTMRQALSGSEYGLVACWGGYMGTGLDLSLNENNLDYTNHTGNSQSDLPISLPEGSLRFDGSSGYATLGTPSDLDFSGSVPYAVAAWIKSTNPQKYSVFFSKNNANVNGEYYLGLDGGKLRGGRQASPYSIEGTTELEADLWYHVAMTYDGESLALYVNGDLDASADFGSIGSGGSGAEVLIGAMYSSGSPVNFFPGEISELTVWNQSLDSEEIWGLANHQLTSLIPIPVALWNFRTGTIADQSGHGNDMTLNGGAALIPSDFSFDQFSDVLSFTEAGQYVNCGAAENLRFDGSVSMELWMRVERWTENWETVFGFDGGYRLRRNNNTNGLAFTTDGISTPDLETTLDVADGEWHHVAVVYDAENGAKYLYVDGVEQASQSELSGSISYGNTTGFGIGGNSTDPGFQGWITEARVWNKALSLEDDILPHIDRKMVGNEPDLMGYWKCTTVDSSEIDLSSHGNNGTYVGDPESDIAPFTLLPPLPFLTARSKMIQDWTAEHAEANDTQGRTIYQTVITLYSANGNPMPGEDISIWCDEPTDIEVEGEYYSVSDASALPLTTDPTGRITISTVAGALSTPALQLWAPFMKSDDRVIICPDDNVLDGLSVVEGDELQQPRNSQPPLLDPDYFSQEDADDLAEAVRNSIGTVKTDGSTEELMRTPRYTGHRTRLVADPSTPERSMPDVSSFSYTVTDNQEFTRPVTPAADATDWALSFGSDSIWVDGEQVSADRKVRFNRLTPEQIRARLTRDGKPIRDNSLELFSISHAWHSFTRSVEQFASVVVTTAETLGHEIENTVVVVLQEVGQEIEDAAQVIVDDIRQVGEFVVGTLSQAITSVIDEIEDVALKVVAFFRDEFGWEDILMTKNAFSASLSQFAPAVEQIADDFITLLNQAFAALEDVTEDAFNALIADVGEMNIRSATTPPDYTTLIPPLSSTAQSTSSSGGSSESQPNVSDLMTEFSVEANYLLSKLLGADDGGIRSVDFSDFSDDVVEPILGYLSTIIDKVVNSDAVQAFENAYHYFAEIASNPQSFLQLMLQGLLSIVEGIALAAMEILQFGLEMLAQVVKLFIEGFQQMWTAPLEIPVVSWLYENVVTYDPSTGQGSQLTLLDFFSLLLAIPTTLIYKQLAGEAPFTEEYIQEIESSGYTLPPVPDTSDAVEFFGIPDRARMAEILQTIESAGGVRAAVEKGNDLARRAIERLRKEGGRVTEETAKEEEEDSGTNIVSPGWKYTLADTIGYDVTYLMWAAVDMLIDIQRVIVVAPFGGTTSYGAGSPSRFGSMTSGLDFSRRPGLQKVLLGFSFMFPINFQALSFPPAGPGSRYADYGDTTTAQRTDFAFWLYKGLGILANLIVNMIGQKKISSQTESAYVDFSGQLGNTLEEDIESELDLFGVLSQTEVVNTIAQRFLPWVNTLFGGGWLIFTTVLGGMELAAMIEATQAYEDAKDDGTADDNAETLLGLAWGDFILKTMQNGVEGLSPTGKFLGTESVVTSTEGLSLAVLGVIDLTSDVGSSVIGGARSLIYYLISKNS